MRGPPCSASRAPPPQSRPCRERTAVGVKSVRTLLKATFSIVAAGVAAGEVGCAVQSRYFSVGSVVPWAKAGVGAVATQAAGVAAYGPKVLAMLEEGLEPAAALDRALADD